MGQTKKLYEQMTLQDWVMEYYNDTCDSDYQYQEYQEQQNKQYNDQMEDYFKNHLNYEN